MKFTGSKKVSPAPEPADKRAARPRSPVLIK